MIKQYLLNLFIAFDQFWNTVFLGDPDETISSRLGKHPNNPVAKAICFVLDKLDRSHCKNSVESDEGSNAVKQSPTAGFIIFVLLSILAII